jgi:hypothetical protein
MRRSFRTNYWVWAISALSLFFALGFVNPTAGVVYKGNNSLWTVVWILLSGNYHCSTSEILAIVGFRSLLQAVAAIVIGWVVHALVVMLWSRQQSVSRGGGSTGDEGIRNRCS